MRERPIVKKGSWWDREIDAFLPWTDSLSWTDVLGVALLARSFSGEITQRLPPGNIDRVAQRWGYLTVLDGLLRAPSLFLLAGWSSPEFRITKSSVHALCRRRAQWSRDRLYLGRDWPSDSSDPSLHHLGELKRWALYKYRLRVIGSPESAVRQALNKRSAPHGVDCSEGEIVSQFHQLCEDPKVRTPVRVGRDGNLYPDYQWIADRIHPRKRRRLPVTPLPAEPGSTGSNIVSRDPLAAATSSEVAAQIAKEVAELRDRFLVVDEIHAGVWQRFWDGTGTLKSVAGGRSLSAVRRAQRELESSLRRIGAKFLVDRP